MFTFLVLFILILGAITVFSYTNVPNPGHGADQIVVTNNLDTPAEQSLQTYVSSTNSRIDTINNRKVVAYVGSCTINLAASTLCKCNQQEEIMTLQAASARTGYCVVDNQGTTNVQGRCNGAQDSGATFACFRYLKAVW